MMKNILPALLALAFALPATSMATPGTEGDESTPPWIGKIINVHYPIGSFQMEFQKDGATMSWISLDDPTLRDTVTYTARRVKPGIYALNWHEPSYNEDAFQFQDWSKGIVHTVLIPDVPAEIQSTTGTFQVVGTSP